MRCCCVVGIGALVRFATLASQDYWFDEYLTVGIIQLHPADIIDRTIGNDTSPPLYFLIAAGWERVFGTDEVALRSLSALFGTATIPIAYAAGVALGSRRAGLFAAALTASSPLLIWYSQEARPYALFALLSTISFLCFVHALNGRGRGWLGGWVAASVLALGTHYFAIFLIVAEAAWLLWRSAGARRSAAIAIAIVGAAGLALLAIAAERAELAGWIEDIDFSDRVLQVPQHFVVGLSTPGNPGAGCHGRDPFGRVPCLATSGSRDPSHRRGRGQRHPDRHRDTARGTAGQRRLPALAQPDRAVGSGSDRARRAARRPAGHRLRRPAPNRLGAATAAALCVGGLAIAVWTAATPAAGRPDWGELARATRPGTGEAGHCIRALSDASARPSSRRLPGSRVPRADAGLGARRDRFSEDHRLRHRSVLVAGCGGSPATAPVRAPRGFALVDEGATPLFEYRRYRAREPRLLPPHAGCARSTQM